MDNIAPAEGEVNQLTEGLKDVEADADWKKKVFTTDRGSGRATEQVAFFWVGILAVSASDKDWMAVRPSSLASQLPQGVRVHF